MKIYDFQGAKGYEVIDADSQGWDVLAGFDGSPRGQTWTPQRIVRVRPTKRGGFRPSDAPYACRSNILVLRRSAVDALRDILDSHGELLPLEDEEGVQLYAYNPRALEALDHLRTVGSRDEDGRVYLPNNHVFTPSVVEGVDVFRQARKKGGGNIYLSHRFLQRWKKAKLKGLDFTLAWDSDLPPDQQPNVWTSKPVKMSTIR